MMAVRSVGEKRRCLPRKVQGICRAAAFLRSQDSRTCSRRAASAGGYSSGASLPGATPPVGVAAGRGEGACRGGGRGGGAISDLPRSLGGAERGEKRNRGS